LLSLIFHFALTTIGDGGGGGGGHRVAQSELLQEHLLILASYGTIHSRLKRC